MVLIELFPTAELGPDEVRQVELDGRPDVAVYNLDGEFFATDDVCTHGEASLAEGDVDGGEIICPFHLGRFDIRTGEASMAPCALALKTYPIRIDNDVAFIEVED